jgi:hypothetical protein
MFYPGDLPADWRFCYFSNVVRAVLVPEEDWLAGDVRLFEQWREDSDPDFRFIFEISARDPGQTPLAVAREVLGDCLAGLLANGEEAQTLAGLPLCRGGTGPPAAGESRLWRPRAQSVPEPGGSLLVACLEEADPRELRRFIEALAAWPGTAAGMFFTNPATALEGAEQAREVAELLGL